MKLQDIMMQRVISNRKRKKNIVLQLPKVQLRKRNEAKKVLM